MAVDAPTSQDQGISNLATGSLTGDGTITAVTLGFRPRRVHLVNLTDRIEQLWVEGMTAGHTLNRAADGVGTDNSSSLIVPKGGGATDTYRGFEIAAAAAVSAKLYTYTAWG